MGYRLDIAVLRAIAVLSVIFYHFKILFFNGGLIGVDIFFVLSGYLMTKIILTELGNNSFNLFSFYKKRLTRILPALLFLIFCLSIVSLVFLFEDFQMLSRYSFVSEFFVSNYFYLNNSSYFQDTSQNNLLLHTWSLSVEWQFYLLYPIFLLAVKTIFFKKIKIFHCVYLSFTILSMFFMFYHNNFNSSVSFFSFHTRAWEMMLGGLVFILELQKISLNTIRTRKIVSFLSFGIILACCFFVNENVILWPSAYTFLPVLASCLILLCNVNFDFYCFKSIQYISKISYSLYLWHWPFYVLLRYFGVQFNFLSIILLLMVTTVAAVFSYTYIESNKLFKSSKLIIGIALLFGLCHFFSFKMLKKELFKKEKEYLPNISWNVQTNNKDCNCNLGTADDPGNFDFKNCFKVDLAKKNVVLLGDSHAASIGLALKEYFVGKGVNFMQATFSGDAPLLNNYGRSTEFNAVLDYLYKDFFSKNAKFVDLVIVDLNYTMYKSVDVYMDEMEKYFNSKNIKIIFIGQNETYRLNFEKIAKLKYKYPSISIDNYLNEDAYLINSQLKNKYAKDFYVDIFHLKNFNSISGDQLYMYDDDHFSYFGATKLVEVLAHKKVFTMITP